ncbi:MAG: hypothetical protein AB1679_00165 [Actinomycetota bacterium]
MRDGVLRRFAGAGVVGMVLPLLTAAPAGADLPGLGIVKDAVGGASGLAFESIASGIGSWVLGAVAYFVNGVLDFLRSSARPDVEAAWFAGPGSPYATVREIAGVLLVGFVLLGLLQGLLHGDVMGMVRRMGGTLPLAIGGMVVTTAVAGRLVALTDALSNAVLSGTGERAVQFLSSFGVAVSGATQGFAAVVLGLVAVLAALVLWVELIVRASLVYLLVAISPIGFAAMLWPTARGFLRKTLEVLLAVIVSKFVICVALAIGVAALAGAGGGEPAGVGAAATGATAAGLGVPSAASLSMLLVGAVILGLAAFAPFLVLKLIPLAEGALVAQGISRGPVRAAQSGVGTYSTARSLSRMGGGAASSSRPSPEATPGPGGPPTAAPPPSSGPPSAPAATGAGAAAAAGGGAAATAASRKAAEATRRSAAAQTDAAAGNGIRFAPTQPSNTKPNTNGNGKERR